MHTVPPSRRSLALSVVVTGTSIAVIMGMPLGRAIGLLVGWRMTFLCIGIFALLTLIFVTATLPAIPAGKGVSLHGLPVMLHKKVLTGIYVFTLLFATGYYTAYSYIEPFLKQIGGMQDSLITGTLMVFGAAGLVSSVAFSKLYATLRFSFVTMAMCGLTLALVLVRPLAFSHVLSIALCAVWGISSEVISAASEDESAVAMSIYSGIFNLGIGCGALIGGGVCTHLSLSWVGAVGAVLAGAGLLYWLLRLRPLMASRG